MNLEEQLLIIRKLRESGCYDSKAYFYLTPLLNSKTRSREKERKCWTKSLEKIREAQQND
ncbi:hypothetical protein SSSM7_306 [Synechococcus phage S-SSM7]|uniref:Uncharacterized protein n=1 Tax=Synechococcus phage S-SSM7 TaxID=445686 RepID=E3SLL9_9CAUD|nr:hypothetical protein SSSM7_306 [Synechococcus phage S-SSM7]ADO98367.1 hypothetical protein SSSM7_306 [Synechococcus phage S-SSM7]